MKLFIVLVCVFAVSFAAVLDVYPTKYDTIDIASILANKRLSDNYIQCLLQQGKCTEEGQILKDVIPDALITGCSKCNPVQKVSVEKVIRFLIKERSVDWSALLALYDPQGLYQDKYSHYLETGL